MVWSLFSLLGGVTVFLLGLKMLGSIDCIISSKLASLIKNGTKNRFSACFIGMIATAVAQSSVATNIITISFASSSIISLMSACAVIIGTNIGTTITAQLVSLKGVSGIDVTAIGSLIAFFGFLLSLAKQSNVRAVGNVLLGFGLVFIGIEITSQSVNYFRDFKWFKGIFTIKSAPILLLNGFFVTAICQSSSVVTSMLVVLASGGMVDLGSAVFLIMGANIGTCIPVIISSAKKEIVARQVAWFNLLFNLLGSVVYFILFVIFKNQLCEIFESTAKQVSRQIANFHSFFNLSVGVASLILLKPMVRLTLLFSNKSLSAINKHRKIKKLA